jgi:UDP-N-acetylglucosamine 2-epimerase (non-hydrolysing)
MDAGTLVMAGLSADRVLEAVRLVVAHHDKKARIFCVVPDYEFQEVAKKVVRTVLSYTDYVNRTVWHKGEI